MKSIILFVMTAIVLFSQNEYPNLNNVNAFVQNPDSIFMSAMSPKTISDGNYLVFRKSIQEIFGSCEITIVKTMRNPHTDEIDTLKVKKGKGYSIFFNELKNKTLVYSLKLDNYFPQLSELPEIGKIIYADCLNLYEKKHIYKLSPTSITFSTFGDYKNLMVFNFNKKGILNQINYFFYID